MQGGTGTRSPGEALRGRGSIDGRPMFLRGIVISAALLTLAPDAMAGEQGGVLRRVSCTVVRYYVARYSAAAAESWARAHGATDAEIDVARHCSRKLPSSPCGRPASRHNNCANQVHRCAVRVIRGLPDSPPRFNASPWENDRFRRKSRPKFTRCRCVTRSRSAISPMRSRPSCIAPCRTPATG
ncbi:hypothetical protein BE61_50580 [Bradyrhizobium elkanii USDA 61]|nr:hypothetical protein BE61_50580 [Bradyrhizobium elkanii USDA 61]